MAGLSDNEVEILLRFVADLKGAKDAQKAVNDLGSDTKKSMEKGTNSFRGAQLQIRNMLQPLTMVRRTVWQFGLAWGLTAGTVVAAINDVKKKQDELNNLSVKTGLSTEEISKKMYGFNIATKEAKAGVDALNEAQNFLNKTWTAATTAVSTFVGKARISMRAQGMATEFQRDNPGSTVSNEQFAQFHIDAEKELRKEAQKTNESLAAGILLRGEMSSNLLRMQGKELAAFRVSMDAQKKVYEDIYGPDSETVKIFEEFYRMQEEKMNLAQYGFKQSWEVKKQMVIDTVGVMRNSFSSFIDDAFNGQLKTAKEYFRSFMIDVVKIWIKGQIEMAMAATITPAFNWIGAAIGGLFGAASPVSAFAGVSGGSIGGGASSGAFSGVSGGSTGGGMFSGASGAAYFHNGGIVRAHNGLAVDEVPIIAQTGERVLSRKQNRDYEEGGQGGNYTVVTYNINAVDAASFNQLVARNPEAIVAVTEKSIRRNQSMRRTIKEYAR